MFLQSFFVSYSMYLAKYIFQPFVQPGIARLIVSVNCDVYGKISRIEEDIILSSFQELRHILSRFFTYFLVCEFINVYILWFIFRWHIDVDDDDEHIGDFDAFSPEHSQYLAFSLRWRWTWRQGTALSFDRFSMYIFFYSIHVLTLVTEAYDWMKKVIHYLYTLHICTIRTCRDAFNRSADVFGYIRSYIHAYIHTYTFIHICLYIYVYTYVHIYIHTYTHLYIYTYIHIYITKEGKKEICNKYVINMLMYFFI